MSTPEKNPWKNRLKYVKYLLAELPAPVSEAAFTPHAAMQAFLPPCLAR
jgi:hypothetical protein